MYAIIPSVRFRFLNEPYRIINQIFSGEPVVKKPYILLEDDFTEEQIVEINYNNGNIFETSDEYLIWLTSI